MSKTAASETATEAAPAPEQPARLPVQHRTVAPNEAGWRLDRWIRTHFPGLSFAETQKLLRTGQFRVDGKRAEGSLRLAAGQIIRVPPLPESATEPPSASSDKRPLSAAERAFARSLLIYADARILAFNKPAGLAVQGGTKTTRHLDRLLEAFAKGGERPRLVHRLDRDTSGVVVVARTAEVARELGFAFQQHRIRKLYWAILVKGPERNEGEIELPLEKRGPKGREKVEPVEEEEEEGRWAKTAFKVLARAGKIAAWVALMPYTGRTHQLRAHCAAIGAPILGDGKYGGKEAHLKGAPKGLMLHARELELPGPKGKPLRITAEPPPAFRAALSWLGLEQPELPGATLDDWPPR